MRKKVITLSAAQLLYIGDGTGIHSIPFIEAPPVGKTIVVQTLIAKYKFKTVPYHLSSPNDLVSLASHNNPTHVAGGGAAVDSLGFLDQPQSMICSTGLATPDNDNQVLSETSGDGVDIGYVGTLTSGDGSLTLTAYYTEEDAS